MVKISLRTITDDILLLVRNNNVSESEDLSRAQIHSWVKAYMHKLWKDEKDRRKQLALAGQLTWEDLVDDEFVKKIESCMQLESVKPNDYTPTFIKRTVDKLEGVLNNNKTGILAMYDENGESIQYMSKVRRHYNYWRKYTFGELTGYYKDDGHIYIEGLADKGQLQFVYVLWLKEVDDINTDGDDLDEDDIVVPAWMVPTIKELMMKNELAFMLNRPSDDSNNATLASVKPHGPQDDEE